MEGLGLGPLAVDGGAAEEPVGGGGGFGATEEVEGGEGEGGGGAEVEEGEGEGSVGAEVEEGEGVLGAARPHHQPPHHARSVHSHLLWKGRLWVWGGTSRNAQWEHSGVFGFKSMAEQV